MTTTRTTASRPRKKAVKHFDPDPYNPPAILTSRQLAGLLGIHHRTVNAWALTDAKLAACIVRRTKFSKHWSAEKLRDLGYLLKTSQ